MTCIDCKKEIESGSRCNSCTVILHKQRMKRACVEYMGSKCPLCGYDKCVEAFDFHSEDEKDFLSSTQSWQKTFQDLKECIMTCANCHREIHFCDQDVSYIGISHNKNRFFNSLKNNNLQPRGIKKESIKKTDGRKEKKIVWPELEDLIDMLQESSFLSIGKELGVSDNAIRKHLERNSIDYRKVKEKQMYRNGDFEVIVKTNTGRVVESIEKDGKLYIVGEPGREYTISIRNRTGRDAEAIVSVDGLSVMTGEDASSKDGGYLIRRYSTYEIKGWRLNNNAIAKFEFGGVGESYAALSGKPKNIGVIGVAFYLEKQKPIFYTHLIPQGRSLDFFDSTFYNTTDTKSRSNSPDSFSYSSAGAAGAAAGGNYDSDYDSVGEERCRGLTAPAGGDIGTGFGKEASDYVTEVEFERDYSSKSTLSIEYGSRQNLIERGVLTKEPNSPNPFPADKGCNPPKGWHR